MGFSLQNWGRVSVSANEPIVTLTSGVVVGSPSIYAYYSPTDTQATVAVSGYFNSVASDLSVGDQINVYSAAESSWASYLVSAISGAGVVSLAVINGGATMVAQGTISNAQILAGLYGTPVQVVPAPGANKVNVVKNATLSIVYGTTQFQNGGAIRFQYGNTVHAGGTNALATTVAASDVNAATANNFQLLIGVAQAWGLDSALANLGIYLSCATGEFTNGDSSFRYSIEYRIANLV